LTLRPAVGHDRPHPKSQEEASDAMTEANEEISRHRVKAADTGLRTDRPPDAACNVAQRMTYGSRPTLVGLRHRTLTVDFPCQWRQRAAARCRQQYPVHRGRPGLPSRRKLASLRTRSDRWYRPGQRAAWWSPLGDCWHQGDI